MANETQTAVTTPPATDAATQTDSAQTETKTEVAPAAKVEDSQAKSFAILSRKEKQIREYERTSRAQIKAEQDRIAAQDKAYKDWQTNIKSARQNPIKALEAMGLKFEDVQDYVVNGGKITPQAEQSAMKAELAAVKEQQAAFQKQQQEAAVAAQREQDAAAEKAFFAQAHDFVKASPDKYELTNSLNRFNLVEQTIRSHAEKTLAEEGKAELLTFEQAADAVERYLEDEVQEQYKLVSATKKFQAALAKNKDAKTVEEPQQSGKVPVARTISNKFGVKETTGATIPVVKDTRKYFQKLKDEITSKDRK